MNIQNIAALGEQLQSLGFENAGSALLKRICFMPDNFILSQRMEKGKDYLNFHLFFEKYSQQNAYVLMYYDAILQKETALIDLTINGINTAALEERMTEIDWKSAFDFDIKKQWSLEVKTSWENEQKIESVIEDLRELEKLEDGREVAVGLKLKYWAGTPYHELFGSISPLKSKTEVSQRFYLFEGQAGISVEEAYRFLQNKWLEKQMQAKSKQKDGADTKGNHANEQGPAGSGSLRKKRISKRNTVKNNK